MIGTVAPGFAGDTLTLKETAGAGILNLGTVQANGTQQIIYTAPTTVSASTTDAVSYTVIENGATATGTANVQLDVGPSIAPETPSAVGQGQTTDIGLLTPGLAGDTLTLKETAGSWHAEHRRGAGQWHAAGDLHSASLYPSEHN